MCSILPVQDYRNLFAFVICFKDIFHYLLEKPDLTFYRNVPIGRSLKTLRVLRQLMGFFHFLFLYVDYLSILISVK